MTKPWSALPPFSFDRERTLTSFSLTWPDTPCVSPGHVGRDEAAEAFLSWNAREGRIEGLFFLPLPGGAEGRVKLQTPISFFFSPPPCAWLGLREQVVDRPFFFSFLGCSGR